MVRGADDGGFSTRLLVLPSLSLITAVGALGLLYHGQLWSSTVAWFMAVGSLWASLTWLRDARDRLYRPGVIPGRSAMLSPVLATGAASILVIVSSWALASWVAR